jgi:hypothetical protein
VDRKRWFLALVAVLAASAAAQAQTEVREFTVQVAGKNAGRYSLSITPRQDGTELVQISASVRVKLLIGSYSYSIQSTEVWKGYRLQQLKATGSDNGKKFDVSAAPEQAGLRVSANGHERMLEADAWTTSYWKLAEGRFHDGAVPLLDSDTGEGIKGTLKKVGVERLTVAGREQDCSHFRVEGPDPPVDVWYDDQGRLVRQEFTDTGYHTVFHLTSVKR